jgi:CelD/BcsL family acetyltransferase involved in cellulose biosynthesis
MFPIGTPGAIAVDDLRFIQITSIDQLRAAAPDWDDLWWRSAVETPLARAEMLAQWLEHFRPNGGFRAIVVADRQRWVAALPLVACRVGRVIPAGALPCNPWACCGELLLDPATDADAVCQGLLAAVGRLRWPLLWLDAVVAESPQWKALLRGRQQAGMPGSFHHRFRIGRVEISQPWEVYQKRLAKNHRQGMVRAQRRLTCEGEVCFEMGSRLEPPQVAPWMQEALKVEDLGWKGDAGTSILRSGKMAPFFIRQAEQLARWGQLETAAVRLDGQMAAFLYGMRAKGVYFAYKIGYDPQLAAFSPGQLVFHHVLERLHSDGQTQALDFMGPLNQAQMRWRPATYCLGRLVLAPRGGIGRVALFAYQHLWRRLSQWRNPASAEALQPADCPGADRPDRAMSADSGRVGETHPSEYC